jgi:hypothetical protein
MIINYNRNHSFIVLATVITIVNYDHKTFIAQATELSFQRHVRGIPVDVWVAEKPVPVGYQGSVL